MRCAGTSRGDASSSASDAPLGVVLVAGLDARRHPGILAVLRDVDADARHLFEQRAIPELVLHEPPFALGQIAEGRRLAEDVLEDAETDGRLVVGRRDEHAPRGDDLEAEHRRRIEVREEDQDVVLALVPLQVFDERRAPRSLLLEPLELVGAAVRVVVDPLGQLVERLDVARGGAGEAPHRHAADAVHALRIFVLPGHVVAGAGGQHLDVVLEGEPLGEQPAQLFGSAQDFGAVALDDEGEFHEA